MQRMRNEHYKALTARDSIGLILDENATVVDSIVGMPAYNAGIVPGMKIIAVNSRKFSGLLFLEALKATKNGGPLELLVENVEFYKTVKIDYHDGERYPHLVRDSSNPDMLAEIIKPQTAQAATVKADQKAKPVK